MHPIVPVVPLAGVVESDKALTIPVGLAESAIRPLVGHDVLLG